MMASPLDLVREGNTADLKQRLDEGLDPNFAIGPSDHSLLTLACDLGNIEIIDLLFAHKAKKSKASSRGTPFYCAISAGQLEVVKRLAKTKSGLNAQPLPLALAANAGDAAMVKVLLAAKADPNKRGKHTQDTPLHNATTTDIVDLLLDHGADPNAEDHQGDNPVAAAILRGDLDVAGHFFERLPDLMNQKDQYERTPLIKAVARGQVKMANWLIEQGVEVDLPDARGETPLTYAVVKGSKDLALRLIALGAKGDHKDLKGNTPILWAQRKGQTEVVQTLLDMGCAPPQEDE